MKYDVELLYKKAREKELEFKSKIPKEESANILYAKLMSGEKFTHIRLGDIEASFAVSKFIQENSEYMEKINNSLWFGGIDKNNKITIDDFINIMQDETTLIGVHGTNKDEKFWLNSIVLMDILNIKPEKHIEVHALYKIASDERLWSFLKGKKVVMVGAKSKIFRDYFKDNLHYQEAYPEMQLNSFQIVDAIVTEDLPYFALNSLSKIQHQIFNSYVEYNPDIFLFSCGYLSKLMCYYVNNNFKSYALDIGNTLDAIMNIGTRRPFLEKYKTYKHPYYVFELGKQGQITSINKR